MGTGYCRMVFLLFGIPTKFSKPFWTCQTSSFHRLASHPPGLRWVSPRLRVRWRPRSAWQVLTSWCRWVMRWPRMSPSPPIPTSAALARQWMSGWKFWGLEGDAQKLFGFQGGQRGWMLLFFDGFSWFLLWCWCLMCFFSGLCLVFQDPWRSGGDNWLFCRCSYSNPATQMAVSRCLD